MNLYRVKVSIEQVEEVDGVLTPVAGTSPVGLEVGISSQDVAAGAFEVGPRLAEAVSRSWRNFAERLVSQGFTEKPVTDFKTEKSL